MAIIKLLHVLAVFLWVGSLLTLSRLLAYLAKEPVEVQKRMMKILKRMYLAADLPAMVATLGLGSASLILKEVDWKAPWLHMKLTLVFLLIICDFLVGRRILQQGTGPLPGRGGRFKVFHSMAGAVFLGILVAIYIMKP